VCRDSCRRKAGTHVGQRELRSDRTPELRDGSEIGRRVHPVARDAERLDGQRDEPAADEAVELAFLAVRDGRQREYDPDHDWHPTADCRLVPPRALL